MYKFNNKKPPRIFHYLIEKPVHQNPTQFSKTNFKLKKLSLSTTTKYSISYGVPNIWNDFLTNEENEIQSHSLFLPRTKSKLLDAENKRNIFKILPLLI